jgi:hypothetical protein
VVAVDVPSGIDVDSGAVASVAARADVTVTFQHSKAGLHLTPARAFAGRVIVADIGLVAPLSAGVGDSIELIDPGVVAQALASLPAAAHKGRRGHVGVVGGTGGTPGAAVLAGAAALRAGAGLATLAMTDELLRRALIESRPEVMLAERDDRFVAAAMSGHDKIKANLARYLSDPAFNLEFSSDSTKTAESGDMAYTRGRFTVTQTDPQTKKPVSMSGNSRWVRRSPGSVTATDRLSPAFCQIFAWAMAFWTTFSVIGTIRRDCSARGMKLSGGTTP